MEELLNTLFDKHSEGYGVYDRENIIKDFCKQLHDLQLHKTQVSGSNIVKFQIEENWGEALDFGLKEAINYYENKS